MQADDPETAVPRIVELVKSRIPKRFGLDPIRDIQVLCPMNRGGVGARSLNIELQAALNPAGERKVERFGWTFAPGDKVMQIENDYDKEVYNGDIGYIDDVDPEAGELNASFDGRSVTYGFGELDTLVPAYAATIHKSQGSEYPAVVIPIMTQHYAMLQRNLLYTGITRGKRLVVLVGQKKAVAIAVRNVSGRRRWSKLDEWLRPMMPAHHPARQEPAEPWWRRISFTTPRFGRSPIAERHAGLMERHPPTCIEVGTELKSGKLCRTARARPSISGSDAAGGWVPAAEISTTRMRLAARSTPPSRAKIVRTENCSHYRRRGFFPRKGTMRHDVDGVPVAPVMDEHRAHAIEPSQSTGGRRHQEQCRPPGRPRGSLGRSRPTPLRGGSLRPDGEAGRPRQPSKAAEEEWRRALRPTTNCCDCASLAMKMATQISGCAAASHANPALLAGWLVATR